MNYGIMNLIELIGGLGLFLFGMRVMSDNIQRRAGPRLRRVLNIFTANRVAAVFTGLGITAILQSSSASTVLLVSLVNAGLMGLNQAIGVIMGANIGTTLTGWIVSVVGFKFRITALAMPAAAVGLLLMFSKRETHRELSGILLGFGILFMGLDIMKNAVPDIQGNVDALAFLARLSAETHLGLLLFVLVGTLLTISVQSSSAAMAITITMAYKGWITFPVAAAIVLGENIGTTITAFIASLGMNVHAKRAARAHMLFNLIGVAWMLAAFFPFLRLIEAIVPGPSTVATNIPFHLAAFHTAFNIANTSLLIGFVPLLARLTRRWIPDPPVPEVARLAYVALQTSEDVDANLISARHELGRMSAIVRDMAEDVVNSLREDEAGVKAARARVGDLENKTDEMRDTINRFLTDCMIASLNEEQANRIRIMLRVAQEFEGLGDGCRNIMRRLDKRLSKHAVFHDDGVEDLASYHRSLFDFLTFNHDSLTGRPAAVSLQRAKDMEHELNQGRNRLRKRVHQTLAGGGDVRGELLFLDIVRILEQMGDRCFNIARELARLGRE